MVRLSTMVLSSPRKCSCKMETAALILCALIIICTITEVTSASRITRQIKLCEDVEIPQAGTRVSYYDKSENLMKVQFACFQGYSLIGSTEIVCKDGKWSSEAPSCIRATGGNTIDEPPVEGTAVCADPGLPTASGRTAFFTKNKLEVGSKMKYFCNNGYNLEGNEEIICLANGQWSGQLPYCNRPGMVVSPTAAPVMTKPAPTCPEPGSILNGIRTPEISTVEGFTYLVDAQITFQCHDNFHLDGAAKITCTAMGNWDQALPRCRPSAKSTNGLCRKPPKPEIGDFKVTLPGSSPNPPDGFYFPGTVLEYECKNDDLYTLKGSTTPKRTCLRTGNWGGTESRCEINCGKIKFAPDQTSLIINGEPSKQGAWPWQVALALDFDTLKLPKQIEQPGGTFAAIPVIDGWGIVCGAALINTQWVLTAAHCLTNLQNGVQHPKESVMVYAGKHFRENRQDDANIVQPSKALDFFVHDEFDYSTLEADIALILLETPIVFKKWILPVCLPTTPWDLQKSEVVGVIAGWGMTEAIEPSSELRQAAMKWAPSAECEKNFPEPVAIATRSKIKDGMFCGVPPVRAAGSAQSCVGDSGSPLVFPVGSGDDRHWVVEGLVSWGNKNCGGLLTIFTQVRNYVNWIHTFVPPLS